MYQKLSNFVDKQGCLCLHIILSLPLQSTLPSLQGDYDDDVIERHFLYAAVWAFGGHLSPSHQVLFDYWFRIKYRKQLGEELCVPQAGNVCLYVCVYVYLSVCMCVGPFYFGNLFCMCDTCMPIYT